MKKLHSGFCLVVIILFSFSVNAQRAGLREVYKTYKKVPAPGLIDTIFHCLVIGDKVYMDGDIYLGDTTYLNRYQNLSFAALGDWGRWPNGIIPIEIDLSFTILETNDIISSLNEIMNQTNVAFVFHKPNSFENYIYYKNVIDDSTSGGSSMVGMQPFGGQNIHIIRNDKPAIKHETLHALGFYHEMSREDQLSFIKINKENIMPGKEHNFNTHNIEGSDFGDYDFASIMHYPSDAFGKTIGGVVQKTMTPVDPTISNFGFATDLSQGDRNAVNHMYPNPVANKKQLPLQSTMKVGERKTFRIEANVEYNYTDIIVQAGERYKFSAFGRDRWKGSDFAASANAEGVAAGVTDGCRREPRYKMMEMVGDVFTQRQNDKSAGVSFRIGMELGEFAIPKGVSGVFAFFANDCLGSYRDNSGSIGLHIEKLEPYYAELFASNENWTRRAYFGTGGTFFADVTGDGKADAIVSNENGIAVRPSVGTFFGQIERWTDNKVSGNKGTFFADVDGDGKADLITVSINLEGRINSTFVRKSTGRQFAAPEKWSSNFLYGSKGTFFADVTGDGKADAVIIETTGVKVYRSTGTGFSAAETWIAGPYFGNVGTYFADVNGDGKADAIVVNDWGVTVRRSTGTSFSPNETWTSNPYFGSRGNFFADVTGDGKADAIVVNENGITVRRSNGSVFLANETGTLNPYLADKGIFFSDINGTGKCAAIVVNNGNIVARPAQ